MAYADEEFLGPLPADNDHDGWARRGRRAYELEWEDRTGEGQRYRAARAACDAQTQRELAAGLALAREAAARQAERRALVERVPAPVAPAVAPWLPPQGDPHVARLVAYRHGLVACRAFTTTADFAPRPGPDGRYPMPRPFFAPVWLDEWYSRTTAELYDLFTCGREGARWAPGIEWAPRCVYEIRGVQVAWGDTPEMAAAMFRWFQQAGMEGQ